MTNRSHCCILRKRHSVSCDEQQQNLRTVYSTIICKIIIKLRERDKKSGIHKSSYVNARRNVPIYAFVSNNRKITLLGRDKYDVARGNLFRQILTNDEIKTNLTITWLEVVTYFRALSKEPPKSLTNTRIGVRTIYRRNRATSQNLHASVDLRKLSIKIL